VPFDCAGLRLDQALAKMLPEHSRSRLRNWIDAGGKRTAFYSRLPAGTYRFRVIACNNDGVWNTVGAVLTFTVAPFFWTTGWFVSVCLLAAAGGIAWLARFVTRRRMQRKIEQVERQHGIERERARIARDIHDDVGASLSRIAMLSQPVASDLTEPAHATAMMSRIYSTARARWRPGDSASMSRLSKASYVLGLARERYIQLAKRRSVLPS